MIQSKYIAKIVGPDLWSELEKKHNINPFISSSWLSSFSDEAKTPVYIVIYCNGEIAGLISGLEEKSKHLCIKNISKVYHFFSGPFVIDDHYLTVSECIKSILKLCVKQGIQKAYFRSYCFHTNFNITSANCFSKRFRSEFVIDLRCTVNDAWLKIKKNQRKRINKLEKMNVTFAASHDSEALNNLNHGFGSVKERKTTKRHDVSYNPYYMDFVDKKVMSVLLRNNVACIYQISCDEEILCSSFVIENKDYAYSLLFGSSERGYEFGASAALKWELIKKYINEDVKFLNLGGLPNDSSKWGIKNYKESMGAEEKLCVGGTVDRIQPRFYCFLFDIYNMAMRWCV